MTVLQIIHQVSYDEIRYAIPVACSIKRLRSSLSIKNIIYQSTPPSQLSPLLISAASRPRTIHTLEYYNLSQCGFLTIGRSIECLLSRLPERGAPRVESPSVR